MFGHGIDEIFTVNLVLTIHNVKSTMKISSNFVAFLENMNFMKSFFFVFSRSLARGLLMTACDLGAITKPWPTQKRVALLVADEFFYQGDLEKSQLKVDPIDMMNREKKDKLPTMQVGFIDNICSPVYKAFASMSDRLEPMLAGCNKNR